MTFLNEVMAFLKFTVAPLKNSEEKIIKENSCAFILVNDFPYFFIYSSTYKGHKQIFFL